MFKKLVLAAVSATLSVLLIEVGLRILGYQAIYEVYSKPSIFWEHDDLLGWVHTRSSEGIYVGPRPWPVEFETPIQINAHGLRGPEISDVPPGGLRILMQGDSMVAAFEVEYEEIFSTLLEGELSSELDVPVQVINAGVRGYGSDQSYLYFLEEGRAFEPDLVVQFHSANDQRNNVTVHRMRRPFAKSVYTLKSGELELTGVPVPEYPICSAYRLGSNFTVQRISSTSTEWICRFQTILADRSALFTLVSRRLTENRHLLRRLYQFGSPDEGVLVEADTDTDEQGLGYDARLTLEILKAFDAAAKQASADFLVIYLDPDPVLERLAGDGVEALLMEPAFQGLDKLDLLFMNDAHFNAKGHRVLADFLRPHLVEILRKRI